MPKKKTRLQCDSIDKPCRYLKIGLRGAQLQRYLELRAARAAAGPPCRRPLSRFGTLVEHVVPEDTFRLRPTHDVEIWNMGGSDTRDSFFGQNRKKRRKAKENQVG
ncbi:MAG: hypothetical protein WCY09_07910 [Candidatus Omnitrophota bacterium]